MKWASNCVIYLFSTISIIVVVYNIIRYNNTNSTGVIGYYLKLFPLGSIMTSMPVIICILFYI